MDDDLAYEEYLDSFEERVDYEPTQDEVNDMFKRARERWPWADNRCISNYVNMKIDGYPEMQAQVQSGFADPPDHG